MSASATRQKAVAIGPISESRTKIGDPPMAIPPIKSAVRATRWLEAAAGAVNSVCNTGKSSLRKWEGRKALAGCGENRNAIAFRLCHQARRRAKAALDWPLYRQDRIGDLTFHGFIEGTNDTRTFRSDMNRTEKLIIMGVSGCGKTSVGTALAAALGTSYLDGDSLHPPENIEKMSAGIPLGDGDRWPWLERVGRSLAEGATIVGCSALKRSYRDRIRATAGAPVRFIHLAGSRAVIAARLTQRPGHFMPPTLLDSQFAALEPPSPDELSVTIDIDRTLTQIIDAIVAALDRQ